MIVKVYEAPKPDALFKSRKYGSETRLMRMPASLPSASAEVTNDGDCISLLIHWRNRHDIQERLVSLRMSPAEARALGEQLLTVKGDLPDWADEAAKSLGSSYDQPAIAAALRSAYGKGLTDRAASEAIESLPSLHHPKNHTPDYEGFRCVPVRIRDSVPRNGTHSKKRKQKLKP